MTLKPKLSANNKDLIRELVFDTLLKTSLMYINKKMDNNEKS